jgi:hypothetical protein
MAITLEKGGGRGRKRDGEMERDRIRVEKNNFNLMMTQVFNPQCN